MTSRLTTAPPSLLDGILMEVSFYSGAGNLFTLADAGAIRNGDALNWSPLADMLCRRNGVLRTEGLIVVKGFSNGTVETIFLNPDGSSGMMCGNGGRAALAFALDRGMVPAGTMQLNLTMAGTRFPAEISEGLEGRVFALHFQPARSFEYPVAIETSTGNYVGAVIDVGSDHFIIPVGLSHAPSGVSTLDLARLAPELRSHPTFPRGANITFVGSGADGQFEMRTWERGVEAETGACGTATISAGLLLAHTTGQRGPFSFRPSAGSILEVEINSDKTSILRGPAVSLGTFVLHLAKGSTL